MNEEKNIHDERILEVLSEQQHTKAPELSPEFNKRLRESVIQELSDPKAKDDDEFWANLEMHKQEALKAYDRFMIDIQDPDEPASLDNEVPGIYPAYSTTWNPFDDDINHNIRAAAHEPEAGNGYLPDYLRRKPAPTRNETGHKIFNIFNRKHHNASTQNRRIYSQPEFVSYQLQPECSFYQLQPDNKQHKAEKPKVKWKATLSLAAVFVFLICGTLLTRGSLRKSANNSGAPGGQITVVETPGGAGVDNLDIVDTSELKPTDDESTGISGFFQDMWLFIKVSLPYLGGFAVLIVIFKIVKKRKSTNN